MELEYQGCGENVVQGLRILQAPKKKEDCAVSEINFTNAFYTSTGGSNLVMGSLLIS